MNATTLPQTVQPAAPNYRMVGRTMIVASASNPATRYSVTDRGCTCKGFKFRSTCKHVTLRADVLAARAAQPMTDAEYARTLEACDELF